MSTPNDRQDGVVCLALLNYAQHPHYTPNEQDARITEFLDLAYHLEGAKDLLLVENHRRYADPRFSRPFSGMRTWAVSEAEGWTVAARLMALGDHQTPVTVFIHRNKLLPLARKPAPALHLITDFSLREDVTSRARSDGGVEIWLGYGLACLRLQVYADVEKPYLGCGVSLYASGT